MSSAQLFRLSGLALLLGAVTFIVHLGARSLITAGADQIAVAQDALWVPINALGVVGAALVLLGLPGVGARVAGPAGWPGLVGVVLIALAWMFFGGFLSLYSVLIAPWLAAEAPALVAPGAPLPAAFLVTFVAGLVVQLIGGALLALPFLRGDAHPRWVGFALPAAALLAVAGNLIAPSGPASNLALNLLSNSGPALLLVALGALGARLRSEQSPTRQARSDDEDEQER